MGVHSISVGDYLDTIFFMISVLLPTYNGERFLREQIDSILLCLSNDDELLIADDNSSDGTREILTSFRDERIKLFLRKDNIGLNKSIEHLLSLAEGELIFLADQDDVWLHDRITSVLPYFKDYDIVVSDCIVTNEALDVVEQSYFARNPPRADILHNLIQCRFLGCCMGFKKKVAEATMPFPNNIPAHDLWIGSVSHLLGFTIYFSERAAILYRRHSGSVSVTFSKKHRRLNRKLIDRFKFIFSLLSFALKKATFRLLH